MNKYLSKIDAAGWPFYLITLFLLMGPSIYGMWKITYEKENMAVRIGLGVGLAALGAGLVSWAVNSVIQYFRKRERIAERKKAKKRK